LGRPIKEKRTIIWDPSGTIPTPFGPIIISPSQPVNPRQPGRIITIPGQPGQEYWQDDSNPGELIPIKREMPRKNHAVLPAGEDGGSTQLQLVPAPDSPDVRTVEANWSPRVGKMDCFVLTIQGGERVQTPPGVERNGNEFTIDNPQEFGRLLIMNGIGSFTAGPVSGRLESTPVARSNASPNELSVAPLMVWLVTTDPVNGQRITLIY